MQKLFFIHGLLAASRDIWPDAGKDPDCSGEPTITEAGALNQCTPLVMPFTPPGAFQMATCNSTALSIALYDDVKDPKAGCKGDPMFSQVLPLGQCGIRPMMRGMSSMSVCNSTNYTILQWSGQPPAPTGLRCTGAGTHAGSLAVSIEVNASRFDAVSFHVALAREGSLPFLGYVTGVSASGLVSTEIPGLRAGTPYTVQARAHETAQDEGNPQSWSELGTSVACTSAPAGVAGVHETAAPAPGAAPKTRWLEIYRTVGLGETTGQAVASLPDYLSQHNACDLTCGGSFLTMTMGTQKTIPVSRYCVEIEDVMLPNVITASMSGKPQPAPYSDYFSCNSGDCRCMHQMDRSISRLPAEQLRTMCNNPPADFMNNTCRCSEESDKQSKRYVGRAPLPLPFSEWMGFMKVGSGIPDWYPAPSEDSPMGSWYHFPRGGQCKQGAKVGDDGCTWQLSPLSHTMYGKDFVGLRNKTTVDPKTQCISMPFGDSVHNIKVFTETWQHLPVDRPLCGTGAGTTSSSPPLGIVV